MNNDTLIVLTPISFETHRIKQFRISIPLPLSFDAKHSAISIEHKDYVQ